MTTPPFHGNPAVTTLALDIAEQVGKLSATGFATDLRLHRRLHIHTVHSSLAIEGNRLGEDSVAAVLRGHKVHGNPVDILEVKNADSAYRRAADLDPGNVNHLLDIHGVMMNGLVPRPGEFRSGGVDVFDGDRLIHAGIPHDLVPDAVGRLLAWATSTDLHPLVSSAMTHYEFEFIHPFADGNGRMGRLWHSLLLSQWQPALYHLPIETVIHNRQEDYYAAFRASNAEGSSDTFVEFILSCIHTAITTLIAPQTDHREIAAAFLEAHDTATVSDLATHLDMSMRSTERLIASLKREGTLDRIGSPRAGHWVVTRRP